MNVVRYRQWPRQIARQQQINQLFEHFYDQGAANAPAETRGAAQWVPRVDVREEAGRFVILADLPGVAPDAIEIQMDKGVLSIKGERIKPALGEGEKDSRVERRHGAFHREFALPDSADAEGIVASGSHGVLEISIPKKAQPAPRRIQVGEATVQ